MSGESDAGVPAQASAASESRADASAADRTVSIGRVEVGTLAFSDPSDKTSGKRGVRKFAFFGYEIGGWGALLALVISVVTLGLNGFERWFLSANPRIPAPEIINFSCSGAHPDNDFTCADDANLYVVAVPLVLINDTDAPHSFTAISSDLKLEAVDKAGKPLRTISLAWQYTGDGTKPIGAITVPPQSSVSHEVQYHPRRAFDKDWNLDRSAFWRFKEFETFVATSGVTDIRLTFVFDLLESPVTSITATCRVPVDEDFLANAKTGEYVLYSRECFKL